MFSRFFKRRTDERDGPRVYKQMAVTAEAHARMVEKAEKRGESIIDTFDKLMGVR